MSDTRFTDSHEWARREGDLIVVGITKHAAEQLGDVVFVDPPEMGRQVKKGDEFAVVESVKAASDIYAPVAGEVVEVNAALADAPETVNEDPEGAAWFCKIRPSNPSEFEALLDADAYTTHAKTS